MYGQMPRDQRQSPELLGYSRVMVCQFLPTKSSRHRKHPHERNESEVATFQSLGPSAAGVNSLIYL